MKNWTKLLVVVLALAMVLSLAACGGNKPAETTKAPDGTTAPTTPEATPDDSTPESTPEATEPSTTPEATEPGSTPESTPDVTPDSTPDTTPDSTPDTTPDSTPDTTPESTPEGGRPTEPTWEDFTDDAGNWGFIVDKTAENIAVDGVLEEDAYFAGVYLVSEIAMPASGSKFDVFFTADETHIYVFYEFTKAEQIFWDDTVAASTPYWFDCVDFCLSLTGAKVQGNEFRIYAKSEGGMDAEGYFNGGAKGAGLDALYVKYTDKGYNVEFSIPLENVIGKFDAENFEYAGDKTAENGDKIISFTALSTISTAMGTNDEGAVTVTRVYTAACCAAGTLDKANPSYLVVKNSKAEDTVPLTKDGRYQYTLNAGTEALAVDGAMDDAYANGLSFVGKYIEGDSSLWNETNTYVAYMAADADYVYVLYVILDDNIYYDETGSSWWWFDCADFVMNKDSKTGRDGEYEFRIFGKTEGGADTAIQKGVDANIIPEYIVKHTDGGYNVEFKIARSYFTDANVFACNPTLTICNGGGGNYVAVDNTSGAAGNTAKNNLNEIVIVDPTVENTAPVGNAEKGGNIYETTKAAAALTVDGVKDSAYANGVFLTATGNIPQSGSYFNVYLAADDTNVYVLYEFIKNEAIFYEATYKSPWHEDCANFVLSLSALDGYDANGEFHILGGVEGGVGEAAVNSDPTAKGLNNYYVKHTARGYNVEFSFPIDSITGTDTNGDKMFSFTAVSTITLSWLDTTIAPERVYAFVKNGVEDFDGTAVNQNNVKNAPSFLIIKDTAVVVPPEESTPESSETEPTPVEPTRPTENTAPTATTEKGNWIHEINKSETALTVDGTLDAAYANGIFLMAERNLPTSKEGFENSEATLYVYATADETHIYFFYEFIKPEGIFWDEAFGSRHHLDCVDFCLNLAGAEVSGTEFHIMGGVEGAKGTAAIKSDPAAAGVDNWFVKHTDAGYNVEFSIPLENVIGVDANGDKMISYTALSTITLGGNSTAGYVRAYTCAAKASTATNEDKANPSILVIKGTADASAPERTEDGRYTYTLNAGTAALAVDGVKDAAYADGLAYEGKYIEGDASLWNEKNTFVAYIAADADYVYVLYEVLDDNIYYDETGSSWWWFDCADFVMNKDSKAETAGNYEFRIFGKKEGGAGTALANGVNADIIPEYIVKHTEGGYNVEFKIARSYFTDKNVFACNPTLTICNGGGGNYVAVENTSGAAGNTCKSALNEIVIVDTEVVVPPSPTTYETLEDGRYAYTLNAGTTAIAVDGVMDDAYAIGLTWEAIYNTPASLADGHATKAFFTDPAKNTFTVYMAADADYVYVLYVVLDENVVGQANASATYRADCADFILGTGAEATVGTGADMRAFGNVEGALGTADVTGKFAAITELYVKTTAEGYNVEFKIDRAQFADANVFSFLAMGGACATDKTQNNGGSTTVYPCIANGAGEGGNNAKAKLNQVVIFDTITEEPDTPSEGGTLTVEQALKLEKGASVVVEGTVVSIDTAWSDQYKNITVTIADDNGNKLQLYRLATLVEKGDVIKVTGTMDEYNGVKQIAAGATAEIISKVTVEGPQSMTVAEALKAADGTTVVVTGTVASIVTAWSDQYKNITINLKGEDGSLLYIYRLGTNVNVGDVITVTGDMATYSNSRQIGQGATAVIVTAHTCTTFSEANCTDPKTCTVCGKTEGNALGHGTLNAEGKCPVCGQIPTVESEFSIAASKGTLADKTITWQANGFTVVGEQAKSTTAIRTSDSDHYRVYKSSTLAIKGTGITQVVITAQNADYAKVLGESLTTAGATATVDGNVVTVTVNEGTVAEILFTATAQTRITKIVVTYVAG